MCCKTKFYIKIERKYSPKTNATLKSLCIKNLNLLLNIRRGLSYISINTLVLTY